uniref:YbjN domain-containing protein n=1 Tax=Desulfacinum infernum TaxID=35837 RepID=A0A832A1R7_9BACT
MAVTSDALRKILQGEELKFFLSPDGDRFILKMQGMNGLYDVVISREAEGRLVQFRTPNLATCSKGHKHLATLLELLAELNFRRRFIKFAWDPSDGEITTYGDLIVADGTLTADQFRTAFQTYMVSTDLAHDRIRSVIETGTDPGEKDPLEEIKRRLGGEGLLEELKKLLDKLRGKSSDDDILEI